MNEWKGNPCTFKKASRKINNMITESFSGVPFAFTALMS